MNTPTIEIASNSPSNNKNVDAYAALEKSVLIALQYYSNIHRGSGQKSMVSSDLYEFARTVVLDYFNLKMRSFTVIFCTPDRFNSVTARLNKSRFKSISSKEIGLPLGIIAVAVRKRDIPRGAPFQTGGGTPKMVSRTFVIWEDSPGKLEAGTPAIINIIAMAKALLLVRQYGDGIFKENKSTHIPLNDILFDDQYGESTGKPLLRKMRDDLIGRDIKVPVSGDTSAYTYLDNSASTPTFTPIWESVKKAWKLSEDIWPEVIASVKDTCANFFGISLDNYDILFSSNTTEAINIVAKYLNTGIKNSQRPVIINSMIDHHSNELPWRYSKDYSLIRLDVDEEGFIDLPGLEKLLKNINKDEPDEKYRVVLVAINGASNVLGSVNNLAETSRLVHEYNSYLLVDAAQLAGHRSINVEEDDIDFIAFSGHKMYAPFGSGGLIFKKGTLDLSEREAGEIKKSGEENIVGIAALGKAMNLLMRIGMNIIEENEHALTRKALSELNSIPGITIYGLNNPDSKRMADRTAVISFSVRHVPHNLIADKLAEYGAIGARNGCFCCHLLIKHLLKISPGRQFPTDIGLIFLPSFTKKFTPGLVRISFGIENSDDDIHQLIKTLHRITSQPTSIMDRFFAWAHMATPFIPVTPAKKEMLTSSRSMIQLVYQMY